MKRNQEDLLRVSQVAELLGVHATTIRRWELEKKLKPDKRGPNGYRLYKMSTLKLFKKKQIEHIKEVTRSLMKGSIT